MFFDGWADLQRVLIVGVCAYVGLVALLRITGKRTLSKMNAFDLVVTVALGSSLATILLSRDVALAEGLTAFVLLIFLQYAVAWASARSALVRTLVKAEPTLLVRNGVLLHATLKRERVAPDEVLAAIRASGHGELHTIAAVVLETDGEFSVIDGNSSAAPANAEGAGPERPAPQGVHSA
jgi:uncharacterized membrane protein YcaP (DUF421 family)